MNKTILTFAGLIAMVIMACGGDNSTDASVDQIPTTSNSGEIYIHEVPMAYAMNGDPMLAAMGDENGNYKPSLCTWCTKDSNTIVVKDGIIGNETQCISSKNCIGPIYLPTLIPSSYEITVELETAKGKAISRYNYKMNRDDFSSAMEGRTNMGQCFDTLGQVTPMYGSGVAFIGIWMYAQDKNGDPLPYGIYKFKITQSVPNEASCITTHGIPTYYERGGRTFENEYTLEYNAELSR